MATEQPDVNTLSEARLIGTLIAGTEGRPMRFADLPEHIALTGPILNRVQLIWSLSESNDLRREHSIMGTTQSDRKLHLPKDPQVGDPEKVVQIIENTPTLSGLVIGIHSHAIKDTPPSNTDIVNLLSGKKGPQAEIVTTAHADFLIIRTDQTPIAGNQKDLLMKIESSHHAQYAALSDQQVRQFQEKMHAMTETGTAGADAIFGLIESQRRERNLFITEQTVSLCSTLNIALYYSPKTGVFERITQTEQLTPYVDALELGIDESVSRLVRKRMREIDPELKKIDPTTLSEEMVTDLMTQAHDLLSGDVFSKYIQGGFNGLLAAYNAHAGLELDARQFVAIILEGGEYDPEDDVDPDFSITSGTVAVMDQMGLLKHDGSDDTA